MRITWKLWLFVYNVYLNTMATSGRMQYEYNISNRQNHHEVQVQVHFYMQHTKPKKTQFVQSRGAALEILWEFINRVTQVGYT
jgi:hypothetical protein